MLTHEAKIKPSGRGFRKTKTLTTTACAELPVGMRLTIDGNGWGAKGQEVFGNYNPKTKRKCKCVALRVYVVANV